MQKCVFHLYHDGFFGDDDACPNAPGHIDNDKDGVCAPTDKCDNNPSKTKPDACGCDADADRENWDGDSWLNCVDACPWDNRKSDSQICGCGRQEPVCDYDGNNRLNYADCGWTQSQCDGKTQAPKPLKPICANGVPRVDSDGDGVVDCQDECPNDTSKSVRGVCGCFTPDVDTDNNAIIDCLSNVWGQVLNYQILSFLKIFAVVS